MNRQDLPRIRRLADHVADEAHKIANEDAGPAGRLAGDVECLAELVIDLVKILDQELAKIGGGK